MKLRISTSICHCTFANAQHAEPSNRTPSTHLPFLSCFARHRSERHSPHCPPFIWFILKSCHPHPRVPFLACGCLRRPILMDFHTYHRLQFMERMFNKKPEEVTAISNELFKILWKRRHSWAHIDFQFANIYDHSRVGDVEALLVDPPPPEDLMRVRTARIIDNRSGEINLTVPLWLNVANNPNLQSLEVGPWCLDIPPHQNLRELIFTEPLDPSYALHFLDYCPRLERFVVKIRETPGAEVLLLPEGSVVRDQLRHLEINAVGQISAVPIISALTCPRLEFFSAELNGGYIESQRSLISFLCRSDCRLHTLKGLNLRYLNPEALPHFLTLPQLRNLETLLVCNADDHFCEILTQPAIHRCSDKSKPLPILPNLKNLDLIEIWFSAHKFSDMLMSRFDSLQRVQILSNRTIQSLLAYDRLWDFPGTISRVDHVNEVFLELDSFGRNNMSWDPQSLFTAPERNLPLPLPGQDKLLGGEHNRFGRRLIWNTINYLEKVGQGCY
ncbi:hypothetical protein Agabi119p4_6797 [Agaricus bisporus var. burnettii]|uniref:F-box domain-containing protein n=2 Tax=Agaricus bisporus var. burnettii TaxID=192524 RepID=A0A8H7CCK3_AGABI|nr:hypothetical protein Agabi119p4_6797 [Agaricus bisporus var. burnettii]